MGDTGAVGPRGPQGPKGETGDRGLQGLPGVLSVYVNVSDPAHLFAGQSLPVNVYCNDGDVATGGGHFLWSGVVSEAESSRPIGGTNPTGWTTEFHNASADAESVMTAMVVCLDLAQ